MQIIINRIALLMHRQEKARKLKWGVFAVMFAINISVFCIWIPARLQISQTYINVNNIWDRCEKAIIAVVDMGLNFYFIHLIRAKLISNGLTKYNALFRYNLGMIAISLALDVSFGTRRYSLYGSEQELIIIRDKDYPYRRHVSSQQRRLRPVPPSHLPGQAAH
jgi:hypothetical protein